MTIHAAKGLEFPYVTCWDGRKPFSFSMVLQSKDEFGSGAKVVYVAITRAENKHF